MLKGTKFQIMVWNELKKIPEGEVRTYKEIALAIGRPKIPCHRVIRSDGHLGGYSGKGGPSTKRKLLKKEGISSNSIIM